MAVETDRMPVHAAPAIFRTKSSALNRSTTGSPWSPHRSNQTTVIAMHGGIREPASNTERPDADLRRHEPHQTPGEGFLQRLAVEVVLFLGVQRDDPACVVDGAGAVAAARGNRSAQGIPQGAAL